MTKYTPERTKLQHLNFFLGVACLLWHLAPHIGLEVKRSKHLDNLSWCHGVGSSNVKYNFSSFHGICTFSKKNVNFTRSCAFFQKV